MENPLFFYTNRKWEMIVFDIAMLIPILLSLGLTLEGAFEKNWFFIVMGIAIFIIFFLLLRHYRGDIRGYVAVYSNKIVEKKRNIKEVMFSEVVEIRYFKKAVRARVTWYADCLHFYLKDKEDPILINPSFKGTVIPHNMTEETMAILNYIRVNYPSIKYTKEEWKGSY